MFVLTSQFDLHEQVHRSPDRVQQTRKREVKYLGVKWSENRRFSSSAHGACAVRRFVGLRPTRITETSDFRTTQHSACFSVDDVATLERRSLFVDHCSPSTLRCGSSGACSRQDSLSSVPSRWLNRAVARSHPLYPSSRSVSSVIAQYVALCSTRCLSFSLESAVLTAPSSKQFENYIH